MEEAKTKLYKKLNGFRADILKQDWKDDGKCVIGNRVAYQYVSADRVKENLGPLTVKHGLEWQVLYTDLKQLDSVGGFTQHWSVYGTLVLTDIDTGLSTTYSAYGEAGDSGDKGINKAQTDALKQIVFNNFLVANHEDADGEPVEEAKPAPKAKPADPKAAVMAQGEKPAPKSQTPKPKAPAPKLDISPINRAAINRILKNARAKVDDGTMQKSEYDVLELDAESVKNNSDAADFIGRHQA